MKNIIFLLSLPRSGSTMLQKVLMGNSKIATHAEPWILLPLIYSLKRKNGLQAEYAQSASYRFTSELEESLNDKTFDKYINSCIHNIFTDLTVLEDYFLDKTPRYYLILEELVEIFPDAKFIVLYRNPLSIFSSILMSKQMCNNNIVNLDKYLVDLHKGFTSLGKLPDKIKRNAYIVKYEDFVLEPSKYTESICNYLEIPFEEEMLTQWASSTFKGKAGDKEGVVKYSKISLESSKNNTKFATNIFRKKLALRYIKSLDKDALHEMNYNKSQIINDLKSVQVKMHLIESFVDLLKYLYAILKYKIRNKILGV
jgi:hypothetical protein